MFFSKLKHRSYFCKNVPLRLCDCITTTTPAQSAPTPTFNLNLKKIRRALLLTFCDIFRRNLQTPQTLNQKNRKQSQKDQKKPCFSSIGQQTFQVTLQCHIRIRVFSVDIRCFISVATQTLDASLRQCKICLSAPNCSFSF